MATGKASNEDLKSSRLFDVSHVTAVVTGGGSGIGLMIVQVSSQKCGLAALYVADAQFRPWLPTVLKSITSNVE